MGEGKAVAVDCETLDSFLRSNGHVVIFFWTGWSNECKDLDIILDAMESEFDIKVVRVEAETAVDVSARHGVVAVPLCVLCKNGNEVDRVEGLDAIELNEKVGKMLGTSGKRVVSKTTGQSLEERLDSLVSQSKVMLFMKGTPDAPRCGFSDKAVKALKAANCTDFGSFDILMDEDVRQGLKKRSNWPTYPQLKNIIY
eukprot:jgi/Picsp_1/3108/NSC_05949-R1_glutaredoxin 3-like